MNIALPLYRPLLLFVFAGIFSLNASAQLFSEDFGTTFGALSGTTWDCKSASPTNNSSTGPCAAIGDYGGVLFNSQYLTTRAIFIPGSGYCVNFDYSFGGSSGFPRVQIGTGGAFCWSGSMTWTDLATLSQSASCTGESYSLDAFAGQTIYIRFQAGTSFSSWYLDDIVVDNSGCSGGGGGGCTSVVFSDDFADGNVSAPEWISTSGVFTSSFGVCTGGDFRSYFSTFSTPAEIVSRTIDLSGASVAELSLDYSMAAAAFTFHCAYLEVSTNGGSTWNDLNPAYTDPDGSCQSLTVSLNAYLGQIIQLRIRRRTTSYSFYFDNISVCTDGGPVLPRIRWADNFNDNDLVLDYTGTSGLEACGSCGPWVLGGGASLNLVPAGGWNGNTNETEAFIANMPNVYYARLDRNEWIESPVMDLSNAEGFKISFYAKSSSPGTGGGDFWSFSDRLRLQIWDGSAWQTVQSMRDDLSATWNGVDDFISSGLPFNYYCFTAYRSGSSPGNYYYNSSPNVDAAWFHSGFKFRVLFEGGFSGSPFAWVDDFTFRADADGYSTMVPCGLSFWNEPAATAYGQDLGTTGNTNAEKGVELELDNSINIPPIWSIEANDGDTVTQTFGVGESERVVFSVISEQEIRFAFPRVHFYAPSMGWQSAVMSIDNNYTGPGWKYYSVQYISCDLAGGSIAEPTNDYQYYFSFEYGIEFIPVFYQLNTSGIEYGGGVTSLLETFNAPDVNSNCGLLPIEGLSFQGEWSGIHTLLEWSLEETANLNGFELQRSFDGIDFAPLAYLPKLGLRKSYRYLDTQPGSNAVRYYRLKIKDASGETFYSSILELSKSNKEVIYTIAPNPGFSGSKASVSSEILPDQVKVLDVQGKELYCGSGKHLPETLPQGVYFVRIVSSAGVQTLRWLVLE